MFVRVNTLSAPRLRGSQTQVHWGEGGEAASLKGQETESVGGGDGPSSARSRSSVCISFTWRHRPTARSPGPRIVPTGPLEL